LQTANQVLTLRFNVIISGQNLCIHKEKPRKIESKI
jgi:hypothetical protein